MFRSTIPLGRILILSFGLGLAACSADPAPAASSERPELACDDLSQRSAPVSVLVEVGPAPSPAGGTLTDGTYVLTKIVRYVDGAPPTNARRMTLVVAGDRMGLVRSGADDTTSDRRLAQFVVDGSVLRLTLVGPCPGAGGTQESPFSATPTSVMIWNVGGDGVTEIFHLDKQ